MVFVLTYLCFTVNNALLTSAVIWIDKQGHTRDWKGQIIIINYPHRALEQHVCSMCAFFPAFYFGAHINRLEQPHCLREQRCSHKVTHGSSSPHKFYLLAKIDLKIIWSILVNNTSVHCRIRQTWKNIQGKGSISLWCAFSFFFFFNLSPTPSLSELR